MLIEFTVDTFKHFKSDGVYWEMVFEQSYRNFPFGKVCTEFSTVRGGCYTKEDFPSRANQPCFHHVCYDDPQDPLLAQNGEHLQVLSFWQRDRLEAIYTFNNIGEKLQVCIEVK